MISLSSEAAIVTVAPEVEDFGIRLENTTHFLLRLLNLEGKRQDMSQWTSDCSDETDHERQETPSTITKSTSRWKMKNN